MINRKWLTFFLSTILGVVLVYQGCAKKISSFSYDASLDSSIGKYNLGAGGDGYNCVPGKRLGIWLDPTETGEFKSENYLGFIVSYSGEFSAADNYNYYSASAHPKIGPTPSGFKANIFFYEGSDGLVLNLFSNIDEAGSSDNIVNMDIETVGNNNNDRVILSDDNGELKYITTVGNVRQYQGRFHYWSNTDGGVLGPFQGTDFKIRVKFLNTGDVQDARFYSANGYAFDLKDSENQISSFIIAFEDYEDCSGATK
ncbi:MAG: hypothetical protein H6623_07295 [Bdellovibrionaceae bacterium]|nr:hypothetical protein [Pseudobdellovibrionaceae bacterium]